MKLILTRHAKSSWDNLIISDHDRPLNNRGREAATAVGKWLSQQNHVPGLVLCSTAERAKWTCALVIEEISPRPKAHFESALYHASVDQILGVIRQAPQGDLMVVGHNPGIAAMAEMIVTARPKHPKFGQYPTTATLVCEVQTDTWAALEFGQATLLDFIIPREL